MRQGPKSWWKLFWTWRWGLVSRSLPSLRVKNAIRRALSAKKKLGNTSSHSWRNERLATGINQSVFMWLLGWSRGRRWIFNICWIRLHHMTASRVKLSSWGWSRHCMTITKARYSSSLLEPGSEVSAHKAGEGSILPAWVVKSNELVSIITSSLTTLSPVGGADWHLSTKWSLHLQIQHLHGPGHCLLSWPRLSQLEHIVSGQSRATWPSWLQSLHLSIHHCSEKRLQNGHSA